MVNLISLLSILLLYSNQSMAFVNDGGDLLERQEVNKVNNPQIKEIIKSTMVLMSRENAIKLIKGESVPTLFKNGFNYYPDPMMAFSLKVFPCENDKYVMQPSVAMCSGFQISENYMLSAGHCVSDRCSPDMVWVKNFHYNKKGEIVITPNDIYTCKRIVDRKLKNPDPVYNKIIDPRFEDKTPDSYNYTGVIDYAVIKISPLIEENKFQNEVTALISNDLPERGDKIFTIGGALGQPTKITMNGTVLENRIGRVIISDLTAFKGNSGGVVVNQRTMEIEGILVRTGNSFIQDSENKCYTRRLYNKEFTRSNEFTEITPINLIPNLYDYL